MEAAQLEAIAEPELISGHDHKPHHLKSETDREAPTSGNDTTNEDHNAADDVADEYPSVIRRTIIVIGVALALFCVRASILIVKMAAY